MFWNAEVFEPLQLYLGDGRLLDGNIGEETVYGHCSGNL